MVVLSEHRHARSVAAFIGTAPVRVVWLACEHEFESLLDGGQIHPCPPEEEEMPNLLHSTFRL